MSRLQQFSPLVRQFAAPRVSTCQHCFRFSTASRHHAQQSQSQIPPQSKTATPEQAARAADLAAAEALTEGDSSQPPEPKPILPSQRPSAPRAPRTTRYEPRAPPNPAELPPAKYQILRSFNKNLPVYSDTKRGGNLKQTVVRRTSGDVKQLRDELRRHLSKNEEDVKINHLTNHVIVKGHHVDEVKAFLGARGM